MTLAVVIYKHLYNVLVLTLAVVIYKCLSVAASGLLLRALARMQNSTQQRVERIQNYAVRLICSKPSRTPSEKLRSNMNWMPLSKRRELFRLALVHRCVHGWAPTYLAECYETNIRYGHCITRGIKKLHLKSVNTEFGRRATMLKGAQDWNKLSANLSRTRKLLKTQ